MDSNTGVIIICTNRERPTVERSLNRNAVNNWKGETSFQIIEIDSKHARDSKRLRKLIKRTIRRIVSESSEDREWEAVVLWEVKRPENIALPPNVTLRSGSPRAMQFERDASLRILQKLSLTWWQHTSSMLAHWFHKEEQPADLQSWVEQFRAFGEESIGISLARSLSMIPPSQLPKSLGLPDDHANFDKICVNSPPETLGKSAGPLANVLKKCLDGVGRSVEDLSVAIDSGNPSKILWIEDGLFSGTETINVLRSLRGEHRNKPKARPLKKSLSEVNVELRFSVTHDIGYHAVMHFLRSNSIDTVVINRAYSKNFRVLTDEGLRAAENNELYEEIEVEGRVHSVLVDPERHIDTHFLQRIEKDKRPRVRLFCSQLGGALWRNYLETKGWVWPERRILECGLGMRSIGTLLFFAHSVPKAVPPLIWANGTVQIGSKRIEWKPLVHNVA